MKARICKVCATSGVYCEQCEYKIKNSIVSPVEINIARFLYEAEPRFRELQNASLDFVGEIGKNTLIVVLSSNDFFNPAFLSSISKLLSNKISKNVRIVEKSNDVKRLVNQVMYPARVLSVNEVWAPDGTHEYAIRLSGGDAKRLGEDILELEHLLSDLLSSKVRIILE
ncbi:MAG TPA: hypothetical protein VKU94_06630 [Geobacterales bacterium]|nr:hypothetical protein [Geobacterales bacterium]